MRCFSTVVLLICTLVTPGFCTDIDTEFSWIDFSGYDHFVAATDGLTYEDAFEDIDLTVSVTGDFSLPTALLGGNEGLISQNVDPSFQQFDFSLSRPARVVVRYLTTDEFENLDILALNVGPNNPERGALPVVTSIPGGIRITGTASTLAANGASGGFVEIPATDTFTVRHESLGVFKYESFQIGLATPVPEPSGSWLAAFAFPAFMLSVRRQQRRQARRSSQHQIHAKSPSRV